MPCAAVENQTSPHSLARSGFVSCDEKPPRPMVHVPKRAEVAEVKWFPYSSLCRARGQKASCRRCSWSPKQPNANLPMLFDSGRTAAAMRRGAAARQKWLPCEVLKRRAKTYWDSIAPPTRCSKLSLLLRSRWPRQNLKLSRFCGSSLCGPACICGGPHMKRRWKEI